MPTDDRYRFHRGPFVNFSSFLRAQVDRSDDVGAIARVHAIPGRFGPDSVARAMEAAYAPDSAFAALEVAVAEWKAQRPARPPGPPRANKAAYQASQRLAQILAQG